MDQKLLSLAIETLLLRPRLQGGIVQAGQPIPAKRTECNLDAETITAMRDLIVDRITNNAGAMADALIERIKFNALMDTHDSVMFELCDEVVSQCVYLMTQQVSSISPSFESALAQAFSANVYPFAQSMTSSASNEILLNIIGRLNCDISNLQMGINGLMQAMLSSKPHDPFTILRDCNSKVVILHDCPDKNKLRAIADEKKMVVLTTTKSDMNYTYPPFRPELVLLLMLNKYNSTSDSNISLFPKKNSSHFTPKWTTDTTYFKVEQYINNTVENFVTCSYSIREELGRKAPEFLKDFDEYLAVIHSEYYKED